MAVQFTLIMCMALFSVALALPAPQSNQVEPKETMKSAETTYLHLPYSYGYGAGYPIARYSPFAYRGAISYSSGLGYGYPYYNNYIDYQPLYLPYYKK